MQLSTQQVKYLEQLTIQDATPAAHDEGDEGGHEEDVETLQGGNGDDSLTGGGGRQDILGGNGRDTLHGGAGFDFLSGENGDDELYGDQGKDKLSGGNGDDLLVGGYGPDSLIGGNGNDVLDGGNSPDTLTGGRGSDVFVLRLPGGEDDGGGGHGGGMGGGGGGGGHSDAEWDMITDFQMGVDLIALGNQISFGSLSFSGEYIYFNSSDGDQRVLAQVSGIDANALTATSFFTLG